MKIGQFSKQTGIPADTIRYYESLGFFSRKRLANGYRHYSEQDVQSGQLISLGKSMGFSLKEILAFTKEISVTKINHGRIQQKLRAKIEMIDTQISALKYARTLIQQKLKLCEDVERNER